MVLRKRTDKTRIGLVSSVDLILKHSQIEGGTDFSLCISSIMNWKELLSSLDNRIGFAFLDSQTEVCATQYAHNV